MLGKIVKVIVDRPIHSIHPTEKDIVYPINYGFIENTISEVDGEAMDAYILGVDEPIHEFEGKVIAVVHRINEEDKYIVSNQMYSKEEIWHQISFMEQYFKSYIEMNETSKEDILFDLNRSGLKENDIVLFHSSLKSFGKIKGEDIIAAFQNYFKDGLIIFPTHTWALLKEDDMVFDAFKTPSCVGALTNIALHTEGFIRSMHPTHSVCAYGKNKQEYVDHDLSSSTPVSPTGCFGCLKDLNAKIVFLGAPLSKNTFIHSIEEEMQVEDRFTNHIYHFISQKGNIKLSYHMPRHFSTKSPHISDHYEKLYPHMIQKNIAYDTYIGNSKTVVVDAKKCYDYVKELLVKNRHLFDDGKDYKDEI